MDFPKTEKTSRMKPLGERFLRAFSEGCGITDKKVIAEKLGYKSDKAIYKIINEEQEMSFSALRRFREVTEYSTDWLLDGDASPDKDDWVSLRTLLLYGPWLNDVKALWQEYKEDEGYDLSFHEFLAELVRRGYDSFFPTASQQIGQLIQEIVREELEDQDLEKSMRSTAEKTFRNNTQAEHVQDLGTIDEFLADSIRRHDDPSLVMQEWWAREGWPLEQLSVPDFRGWDALTLQQKIKEIKSQRDIIVRHIGRNEILTPRTPKPAS